VDAVLSVFPSEESGDGSMGFALFFFGIGSDWFGFWG
jgi:hypothetical protein